MAIHDTIGDFLTVIRNASAAGKATCTAHYSKMRFGIAKILHEEGYISNYQEITDSAGRKQLIIKLKYVHNDSAIAGIDRYSKPGRRLYCGVKSIPRVLGGLGISIISTPRGVLSDSVARREGVGGEIIAKVW